MAVAAPRLRIEEHAPRAPARDERRSAPRRASSRPRPLVARGVVWIIVVAALLAGIVALNVTVLQLRLERGRALSDVVQLRAENLDLRSQLRSAGSVARVESAARRLGLVEPAARTYLELGSQGR